MNKSISKREKRQASREIETRCWVFLKPFLEELHKRVDRRLVKTLLDLVLVILMHRHRNNGLLLSELGDHLMGGERGPAGVKRIASLLHELPHKKSYFVKIRCLKKDVTLQWAKKPAGGAYDEPTKQTRITGKDSATLSKSRKKREANHTE